MLTKLKYVVDESLFQDEQPYELFGFSKDPDVKPAKITNCSYHVASDITIEDARISKEQFDLNSTGFVFTKHQSACPLEARYFEHAGKDLENRVVAAYLEEIISFLEERLNAEKVICFDWRFRRSTPPTEALIAPQEVLEVRFQALPPGLTIHCDFSHQGGRDRLEMHLTSEELEMVDSEQWTTEMINAWRPFKTVKNAPLVLTDRRSVQADDLLEVDKVLPDKIEKAYYVKHKTYHKWYWFSDQTPDDLALFKTWTLSRNGELADFPPHGAAMHFSKEDDTPRESIEVRMIVLKRASES